MKINVGKRNITQSTEIHMNDIPLCFIDATKRIITPHFSIQTEFLKSKKEKLTPNWTHANKNPFLFDDKSNIVLSPPIQRTDEGSRFAPNNSVSFVPISFSFDLTLQKIPSFDETKYEDISVAAIDATGDSTFSKTIMNMLSSAKYKDKCPSNIVFNHGETSFTSLFTNYATPDFIFASSSDGIQISGTENASSQLAENKGMANQWIFIDKSASFIMQNQATEAEFKRGHLNQFYQEEDRKPPSHVIDIEAMKKLSDGIIKPTDVVNKVYDDIYVVEKENHGYLIVSPSSILEEDVLQDNEKVILDVLLYIYFRSYKKTSTRTLKVTDYPVDYRMFTSRQWNRYHEPINIKDIVDSKLGELHKNYKITGVGITRKDVSLIEVDTQGNLSFRKTKDAPLDPAKKENMISFTDALCTRVWLYEPQNVYELETPLSLSYKQVANNKVAILVNPMRSSQYGIRSLTIQTLYVTDFTKRYVLCVQSDFKKFESKFKIVEKLLYEPKRDGIHLADITFTVKSEEELYDIRIPGGGLPVNEPPNYNLIDIGNIYGRPYRLGSTLIIKLPKRLEPYKDKIHSEVEKHIASGEYFILLFTEEDGSR